MNTVTKSYPCAEAGCGSPVTYRVSADCSRYGWVHLDPTDCTYAVPVPFCSECDSVAAYTCTDEAYGVRHACTACGFDLFVIMAG